LGANSLTVHSSLILPPKFPSLPKLFDADSELGAWSRELRASLSVNLAFIEDVMTHFLTISLFQHGAARKLGEEYVISLSARQKFDLLRKSIDALGFKDGATDIKDDTISKIDLIIQLRNRATHGCKISYDANKELVRFHKHGSWKNNKDVSVPVLHAIFGNDLIDVTDNLKFLFQEQLFENMKISSTDNS